MENINKTRVYDVHDAAKRLGYTEPHLRLLCRTGKIGHVRRGRKFFFTAEQLNAVTAHMSGTLTEPQ